MNLQTYKATLDQLGTNAPQAYQRENNIGNAVYEYVSIGRYKCIITGSLKTSNVIFCPQNNVVFNSVGTPFVLKVDHVSNGVLEIETLDMSLNPIDEALSGTPIELYYYVNFTSSSI